MKRAIDELQKIQFIRTLTKLSFLDTAEMLFAETTSNNTKQSCGSIFVNVLVWYKSVYSRPAFYQNAFGIFLQVPEHRLRKSQETKQLQIKANPW